MAGRKRVLSVAGATALRIAAGFGRYVWHSTTYAERDAEAVAKAGFVEKQPRSTARR